MSKRASSRNPCRHPRDRVVGAGRSGLEGGAAGEQSRGRSSAPLGEDRRPAETAELGDAVQSDVRESALAEAGRVHPDLRPEVLPGGRAAGPFPDPGGPTLVFTQRRITPHSSRPCRSSRAIKKNVMMTPVGARKPAHVRDLSRRAGPAPGQLLPRPDVRLQGPGPAGAARNGRSPSTDSPSPVGRRQGEVSGRCSCAGPLNRSKRTAGLRRGRAEEPEPRTSSTRRPRWAANN